MRRASLVRIAMAASALIGGQAARAIAQDESVVVTVVADQIRSQGFECDNPRSAERIAAESAPEEPVYLLTCENATYRVQLVPDEAARVIEVK